MSDDEQGDPGEFQGSSGDSNSYDVGQETRTVVIGFGVDFHDWDWLKGALPGELGAEVEINDSDEIEYTNADQNIHYLIRSTESKSEFKDALETEGQMVIYAGHSRYGRGCCFGQVPNTMTEHAPPGEHWEQGSDDDDGLFRMAFPYVAVHLSDIRDHHYTFRPVAASEAAPPREERHPEAAHTPVAVLLPEDLRDLVDSECAADDHQYWGYTGAQPEVLLRAGWTGTISDPFDLGGTDLQCRCFCHFGCSSRLHFRPLIRGGSYKGWERDTPPTTRFAYFTTAPALPAPTAMHWLAQWMKTPQSKANDTWADGLHDALNKTNRRLVQLKATDPVGYNYQVY